MQTLRTRTRSFNDYQENEDIEIEDLTNNVSTVSLHNKTDVIKGAVSKAFGTKKRALSAPRPIRERKNSASDAYHHLKDKVKSAVWNVTHRTHKEKGTEKKYDFKIPYVYRPSQTIGITKLKEVPEEDFILSTLSYTYSYQAISPSHPTIDERFRTIIINFMFNCWSYRKLQSETYFLAVHLLDRHLATMSEISKETSNMEHTILGAMQIAHKYEFQDFLPLDLTDSFDLLEINNKEVAVLRSCSFEIGHHTAATFMRFFQTNLVEQTLPHNRSLDVYSIMKTLCILATYNNWLMQQKPSLIVTTALRIAFHILGEPWNEEHEKFCQHNAEEIAPLGQTLCRMLQRGLKNFNFYQCIAHFCGQWNDPETLQLLDDKIEQLVGTTH